VALIIITLTRFRVVEFVIDNNFKMAQDLVSPSLYPTAADLALLDGAALFPNHLAQVARISSTIPVTAIYRYVAGSTSPNNNQSQLVIVPGTNPASGKWLRVDSAFDLVIPVTFANTDGQQLVLSPAEMTILPVYAGIFIEVVTPWAGGVAPTIGLSFSNGTVPRLKGNLAGGVAGNGAFTYVTYRQLTLGQQYFIGAGTSDAVVLGPGSQIFWDRITSAYTSGTGNIHIPVYNFATSIVAVPPP